MTRIAVTGSVAFDNIMVFPGRFAEHILPGHTHEINVSFMVSEPVRRRGGNGANISYTLGLLGETPLLIAAVGHDFGEYGAALSAAGVDVSSALHATDVATAQCQIMTDADNNQITAFAPGAMLLAAQIDLGSLPDVEFVVVAPDAPDAMATHIRRAGEMHATLVFMPAQQLPRLDNDTLRSGLGAAWMIIANDYEMEMIAQRTGLTVDDLLPTATYVAVTRGREGSDIYTRDGVHHVPVAAPREVIDPTGAGDAYLAGLLRGLRLGLSTGDAGRMGALAATYVIEQSGTQGHSFTVEEFASRYRAAFDRPLIGVGAGRQPISPHSDR